MYPNEKNIIVMPITKRMEIIMESKFVSFHGITLIIRKVVERKAFMANAKRQFHVSQCGEHDCSAENKNRDCYGCPSLSHFMDKL